MEVFFLVLFFLRFITQAIAGTGFYLKKKKNFSPGSLGVDIFKYLWNDEMDATKMQCANGLCLTHLYVCLECVLSVDRSKDGSRHEFLFVKSKEKEVSSSVNEDLQQNM